jgi:hypothetical protein
MARLEHAVVAVVLLVAFVADLRLVVPIVAVLLAAHAVVTRRRIQIVEAALLVLASLAFAVDREVAAWTLTLAAAVLCGIAVSATGGSGAGRRVAGSSSRAG